MCSVMQGRGSYECQGAAVHQGLPARPRAGGGEGDTRAAAPAHSDARLHLATHQCRCPEVEALLRVEGPGEARADDGGKEGGEQDAGEQGGGETCCCRCCCIHMQGVGVPGAGQEGQNLLTREALAQRVGDPNLQPRS
eukprot:CAMPEP_0202922384 /NCGR_PEP_ID=MMETSP1392-20130828/77894_1 /ASSEMBLY_ACC=CAM_ASM_000868 /TAXON_ID=225041 /ORGANISM="Chlamydomonas chlamydogama, Strain SAG 11-48b" /LENGTH=137 /DNA_ID=CAMNT_0049616005 /DNA_START=918 /DNA_END=1332 /DNA_ORIENTATION=-